MYLKFQGQLVGTSDSWNRNVSQSWCNILYEGLSFTKVLVFTAILRHSFQLLKLMMCKLDWVDLKKSFNIQQVFIAAELIWWKRPCSFETTGESSKLVATGIQLSWLQDCRLQGHSHGLTIFVNCALKVMKCLLLVSLAKES